MGTPEFDRFFDLPPEIREDIISYLTTAPDLIPLNPLTPFTPFPHDLFLSHPLLHATASLLYYTSNTFILDLTAHARAATERALADPYHNILLTPSARRRIRHLTFRPARLGTAFTTLVLPALTDMILAGRLRHLTVLMPVRRPRGPVAPNRPAPPPTPTERAEDAAFASSPAFRALLRLLADPDLETARLTVLAAHRPLWCAFHDEGAACCFAGRGRGVADVDWRALAAECAGEDPELHIARVGR
ncbi:hypothetical protein HYQ45_002568 [Verticillium longisporum]|uniref:Uncharacterized protein n=2 Tax=Verticillium TaxID=1036719 RepID=A0A2J8CKS7_VERDA|nr:hypothetical protein HYQ45_002568 [Verticillium longisporum]KAH6697908.1 hypothetical protein EV126DRAFT_479468 [Verticillium dahliae]PNH28079.1 hypothetical protein BJF96_g8604 [Verticillium dahliae]PNH37603.1 hypothetical protein VD0004_g9196 [Verticillium dahliae]PNH45194.1 hypothetical protein VD0003_g9273 [Verticillium dahliae]